MKDYRRPPYQGRRILVAVLRLRLCKLEDAFWARGHPVISEPDLGRTYRSFRQQVTPRLGGLPGRRPRHETLFSVCLPFAAHVLAGDGRGPRGRYSGIRARSILGSSDEFCGSELTRATEGGRDKTCNHHHHHHHTQARRGSSRPRPASCLRRATSSTRQPWRRRPRSVRLGFGIGNRVRRREPE